MKLGISIPVTMSFGLTGFIPPIHGTKITMKALIERRTACCTKAKDEGRNRVSAVPSRILPES